MAGLELQPRFARGLGQRLDAPVIQKTAAIEDHALYALLDGALRNRFPDLLGGGNIAARLRLQRQRGSGYDRLALLVVDHLGVNVVERTIHIQSRPFAGPTQLDADARMNALPDGVSLILSNHVLSRFLSPEPPCGSVRVNGSS